MPERTVLLSYVLSPPFTGGRGEGTKVPSTNPGKILLGVHNGLL